MILQANAMHIPLADESVNCCVSSPPYWGLRDYGTARWEGGDPECDHSISEWNDNMKPNVDRPERDGNKRQFCLKCGARRIDNQLGLEPTPEEYVANMVAVFREVWRVLKPEGTLWLNLGDSYNSNASNQQYRNGMHGSEAGMGRHNKQVDTLKPKDLVGIPWRVAFALQADGWYLRQDIIWAKAVSGNIRKGSAMPESVTDRFCKSHEYLFLLTKKPRYYFDNIAVADNIDNNETHEYNYTHENKNMQQMRFRKTTNRVQQTQTNKRRTSWYLPGVPFRNKKEIRPQIQYIGESKGGQGTLLLFGEGTENKEGISSEIRTDGRTEGTLQNSRQKTREGAEIQGSSQALRPERKGKSDEGEKRQAVRSICEGEILEKKNGNKAQTSDAINGLYTDEIGMAGDKKDIRQPLRILWKETKALGNGSCGSVEQGRNTYSGQRGSIVQDMQREEKQQMANRRSVWLVNPKPNKMAHFATYPPDLIEPCILAGCPYGGIVLDPFFGSGTTGEVAIKHGRRFVGLDISREYIELAQQRTSNIPVMLPLEANA